MIPWRIRFIMCRRRKADLPLSIFGLITRHFWLWRPLFWRDCWGCISWMCSQARFCCISTDMGRRKHPPEIIDRFIGAMVVIVAHVVRFSADRHHPQRRQLQPDMGRKYSGHVETIIRQEIPEIEQNNLIYNIKRTIFVLNIVLFGCIKTFPFKTLIIWQLKNKR